MEYAIVYIFGGLFYGLLETLWRGWTHWTMLLCGGTCFSLMYLISLLALPKLKKWALSACAITIMEYTTGCIVNLALRWNVWDYSELRYNILGQICPQFTILWFGLSIPGIAICKLLRRQLRSVLKRRTEE